MSSLSSSIHSLALLVLAAGALPVAAQRVEISTKRVGRSDMSDSVRKLQRSLDSLSHVYTDDDQLSIAQRRRLEGEIRTAVERLDEVRTNSGMLAPTPPMGVRAAQGDAEAMSRALMQVREYEAAMPRGWIGFVAQGPGIEPRIEGGQLIVRYFSYPRILSVDPSSPAQAAGIAPDDTLLAYDGRDVRENDISLTRLLRPNTRVRVRVLRDGRVHEIPVTVAVAPAGIARRRGVEAGGERETWVLPEGPSFPRIAMVPQGSAVMRSAPRAAPATQTGTSATPTAPSAPTIFFGMMNAGVAGAQLSTLTRDFSQAMGLAVTSGVMVMNAPLGSLAYESGLRDGDIITKVAGQVVRSVPEVRGLVELANNDGGHSVDMEILRQKKTQRIVLKW